MATKKKYGKKAASKVQRAMHKMKQGTLKLGQARGIALLVPAQAARVAR